jgi:hypothetical protein
MSALSKKSSLFIVSRFFENHWQGTIAEVADLPAHAAVLKLADRLDLESSVRKDMRVRVSPAALAGGRPSQRDKWDISRVGSTSSAPTYRKSE